jgi:predicted HD phosphohydrolase
MKYNINKLVNKVLTNIFYIMSFDELINRLPSNIVRGLKNETQDAKHHPEGSVYNHIKLVWKEAEKHGASNDILIAVLFHDLGKLDTRSERIDSEGNHRIQHIGHEEKSLEYLDKYLHLYSDVYTDKARVYSIVSNHMKAHLYSSGGLKKPAKRTLFANKTYFKDIMEFSFYDTNGR